MGVDRYHLDEGPFSLSFSLTPGITFIFFKTLFQRSFLSRLPNARLLSLQGLLLLAILSASCVSSVFFNNSVSSSQNVMFSLFSLQSLLFTIKSKVLTSVQ